MWAWAWQCSSPSRWHQLHSLTRTGQSAALSARSGLGISWAPGTPSWAGFGSCSHKALGGSGGGRSIRRRRVPSRDVQGLCAGQQVYGPEELALSGATLGQKKGADGWNPGGGGQALEAGGVEPRAVGPPASCRNSHLDEAGCRHGREGALFPSLPPGTSQVVAFLP